MRRRRRRCYVAISSREGLPLTTGDLVGPAIAAEEMFNASCLSPATAPTIRRLAALRPNTLAVMHGSSFTGDGHAALEASRTITMHESERPSVDPGTFETGSYRCPMRY